MPRIAELIASVALAGALFALPACKKEAETPAAGAAPAAAPAGTPVTAAADAGAAAPAPAPGGEAAGAAAPGAAGALPPADPGAPQPGAAAPGDPAGAAALAGGEAAAAPPVAPVVQGPDPTQDPSAGKQGEAPQKPVVLPPTIEDGGVAAPELPPEAGQQPATVAQANAVVEHLASGNLSVQPGPAVNAAAFGASSCLGRRIEGLDAAVCQYGDEGGAQKGAVLGKQWLKGAVSGVVLQRGATTLAVADRGRADLNGKAIQKISVQYVKIQ